MAKFLEKNKFKLHIRLDNDTAMLKRNIFPSMSV